jgi:hypothetical protein
MTNLSEHVVFMQDFEVGLPKYELNDNHSTMTFSKIRSGKKFLR